VVAAALFAQGCVFVPRTKAVDDSDCKVLSRQWTLEAVQIGQVGSCGGKDCGYLLAGLGLVAAGSAVISGSVVVAGNTIYWLEKQGRCPAGLGVQLF
jgi:hypothetical protein